MSFWLAFGLVLFAGICYMLSCSFGIWGPLVLSALLLAGVISAVFNAWNALSKRLDRIERALGIEESPEEDERDGESVPDDSLEEI